MSFSDERDLLKRWTSLVLETDPDVIIGGLGCWWGVRLFTSTDTRAKHTQMP